MSLLIKALDKAQTAKTEQTQAEKSKLDQAKSSQMELADDKTETKGGAEASSNLRNKITPNSPNSTPNNSPSPINADIELSLSPTGSSFSETVKPASIVALPAQPAPIVATSSQPASNQDLAAKSAANVFSAKGVEAKTDSARLALIAGAGLITLLGMGLYFYQFVDNSPPIVVPPRPVEDMSAQTMPTSETVSATNSQMAQLENTSPETAATAMAETDMPSAIESTQPISAADKRENINRKRAKPSVVADEQLSVDESGDENTLAQPSEELIETATSAKPSKKTRKSKNNAAIASDSASIQVTKSAPQAGTSPILISAYEAYNAGNDNEAQRLYKQVLKGDIHNVDALLGLGAVASRQGRNADANGWYSKVLEVDPNNNIAKTAKLDNQSEGNELANESSLKNMLARQPDDANLHVALGNLYAEQNQWPAAQQAYFDAYRLNKTADNAYNLAVSLDQMGKPKLALPYYQRALELAGDKTYIDKAALEARIAAIQ